MGNSANYPKPEEDIFKYGSDFKVKPGFTSYEVGNEVDLDVSFNVTREKLPEIRVDIHLVGFQDVYWNTNTRTENKKDDSLSRSMFNFDNLKHVDQLYSVDQYSEKMEKGTHEYKYHFLLPDGLPGSFLYQTTSGSNCSVVYYAYVELHSINTENEVLVGRCVTPIYVKQKQKSVSISKSPTVESKLVYTWCAEAKQFSMDADIESNQLKLDEPFKINMEAHSEDADMSKGKFVVTLKRKVTMRMNESEYMKELFDTICKREISMELEGGSNVKCHTTINFTKYIDKKIPKGIQVDCLRRYPTYIQQTVDSKLIDVEYFIEVSVKFLPFISKMSPEPKFSFPVVVYPVDQYEMQKERCSERSSRV